MLNDSPPSGLVFITIRTHLDKRFLSNVNELAALHMKSIYRISNTFTICDLAVWEKQYGTKPTPLNTNPLDDAEAVALCESDLSTITDKEAERLENKMDELCRNVAGQQYGEEAFSDTSPYFVVWHPQEKKFYGFHSPNR